jgi:hypothetical protein
MQQWNFFMQLIAMMMAMAYHFGRITRSNNDYGRLLRGSARMRQATTDQTGRVCRQENFF